MTLASAGGPETGRRRSLACLLAVWVAAAAVSDTALAEEAGPSSLTTGFTGQAASGYESNIFLSDRDPQGAFVTTVGGHAHLRWRPSRDTTLFADLLSVYQAYPRFPEANQFYLDGAIDVQHRVTPKAALGLSQLVSHVDVRLLDTEGEPLPRSEINSVTYEARGYGTYGTGRRIDVEAGGGYGVRDVKESQGFPSLDSQTLFFDAALRAYVTRTSLIRLKYVGTYLAYDHLPAGSTPTGLPDPENPRLTVWRHEMQLRALIREISRTAFDSGVRIRYNDDRFQDQLTYFQYEWNGRADVRLPWTSQLAAAVTLRARDYRKRASNVFVTSTDPPVALVSPDSLEERFMILDGTLGKDLGAHVGIFVRYQWVRKQTNAIAGDFRNSLGQAGVRATF